MRRAVETLEIPLGGMTCAACQASVQRALSRVPGVRDASVNLMLKNAAVVFDPAMVRPARLVEVIRDTGYDAFLPAATATDIVDEELRDREAQREFATLRRKAVVSLVSGVVAMIVSMPLMTHGVRGGNRHRRRAGIDRSVHAMDDGALTPVIQRRMPWLYRIDPACSPGDCWP